ncbi:MAG: porin [Flavobacteriales bacterium]|nr:MAG: porin [Flavobacteriales bacterium]
MKQFLPFIFLLLANCFAPMQAQELKPRVNAYNFGDGFTINDDEGGELRIIGYLQPYMESRMLLDGEDNPQANRFRMRRLRLRVQGRSSNDKFSYRFQTDLSGTGELLDGNNNFLLDAWVAYNFTRRIRVTFGQRAPFSDNRELWMNSNTLQLVERSRVTSAFSTIREFGVFMDGTFRMLNRSYIKPYLMVTNGDGPNVFLRDRGGLKYAGRFDILPFGLFNNFGQFNQVDMVRERTPKLVFGGHYSYNVGISGRRGRTSGSILYLDDKGQELLPDYYKYGVDFLFKFRGFSAIGEFVRGGGVVPEGIAQRVRNDGSVTPNFVINGEQNIRDYILGRMMVGSAYNIQMGYLLKSGISIDGRFTHLIPDEHSFLRNPTFYNRPNYYTLGLSKYLGRNYGAKLQADITYVTNNGGINNSAGLPVSGNELIFRIMSTYSF